MASQDVLLDALRSYDGTLLVVSHDRYFLDRLVDRVIEFENGSLHDWPGTLSQYIERKGLVASDSQPAERVPLAESPQKSIGSRKSKEQKRAEAEIRNQFSREIRELQERRDKTQAQIDQLEARKRKLESALSDDKFYNDAERSRETVLEYRRIQAELPILIDTWEAAALRLEEVVKERDSALKPDAENQTA